MVGPENVDARGATPDGGLKPLEGPLVEELLMILPKPLGLAPEDLLDNPDVRILEDKKDPDAETLGTSSLQALRAMNAVETKYGFQIPQEELASFRTFRSIVAKVESVLAARQPGT